MSTEQTQEQETQQGTSFDPKDMKEPAKSRELPGGDEIKRLLAGEPYEVDYCYNLVIQADEFKIEGEWTTNAGYARAFLRKNGERLITSQWQDALAYLQDLPEHHWHPWMHIDKDDKAFVEDEDMHWIAYAVVQNIMMEHPPHQPIFVYRTKPAGTVAPPALTDYEPSIFHYVRAGAGETRGRMVGEAIKSGKVAVMPTRRVSEYLNDERFYICGDLPLDPNAWDLMYRAWLANAKREAIPEFDDEEDENLPPLPRADVIVRDIMQWYHEQDGKTFKMFEVIPLIYWGKETDPNVADFMLRNRYSQLILKVTNLLRADGWTRNSRKMWRNPQALAEYRMNLVNNDLICAHRNTTTIDLNSYEDGQCGFCPATTIKGIIRCLDCDNERGICVKCAVGTWQQQEA